MKKGLLSFCIDAVWPLSGSGESYRTILRYFYPEFITSLVLYSLLSLLDARFIAELRSTTMYATLGVSAVLIHFITKCAEGAAGSITILSGQYNGVGLKDKAGQAFVDAFWVIMALGFAVAAALYFGAYYVYALLGVSGKMIHLGVPFLRVRAIGIFFMFVYLACVAFLRSFKNTKTPMQIFIVGAVFFVIFDYMLIFGVAGMPRLGLLGSAWATLIQYLVMCVLMIGYILFDRECRAYSVALFKPTGGLGYVTKIMALSWPMIIDKATVAAVYLWLNAMIAPMGKYALASYGIIREMERFAFLPAIAFAQIITFLVSNDFGRQNWDGITNNIKKVILLAGVTVFGILLVFSLMPAVFIGLFDQKHAFTAFASSVFPLLSILVFFDLVQLVLSAALRGAGDVKIVMWTRVFVVIGFFCPVSYLFSWLPITDQGVKFFFIYAIFYVGSALMSLVYLLRFRSGAWKGTFKRSE